MSLVISKVFTYDTDAGNYIQAVEAADGQALESATRKAINDFVIGCKQDGIWAAIKASCILSGARTLAGALVPLVGTAPTKNGTAAGWNYDRKLGLKGNAVDNYINSNRAGNADPQDSTHCSVRIEQPILYLDVPIGSLATSTNRFSQILGDPTAINYTLNAAGTGASSGVALAGNAGGFYGMSRLSATQISIRRSSATVVFSQTSVAMSSQPYFIFARNLDGSPSLYYPDRITFYSIGESLDLARLDSRVTDLINAFGAAIP
jgi:hypothetical protein